MGPIEITIALVVLGMLLLPIGAFIYWLMQRRRGDRERSS